ncbi:MAG: hypothetical protein ACKOC8_09275 [Pirellulales bacterium]
MAVVAYREVLPRTFSHRFGESPTAERKYIITVDEPTPTQTLINAVGITHGTIHPEYAYLRMLDASLSESDRHHVEITYRYELPKQEDLDPNPLARPDVWSFSTGGSQVPALTYSHGSGNNDIRPLQNSAKEYVEGLTTLEAEVRASISGNRSSFPLADAAAVTNCVNSSTYLGGAAYTWQCAGISGQQATEVVNDVELRYWQITVELIYRRSGWNLLIPDVGWNYLEGGRLERAWVRDPETKEKIASGTPRALTTGGALKAEGEAPDIIGGGAGLRVFPAVNFSTYFGTPPF